jgi:hypothetical protein
MLSAISMLKEIYDVPREGRKYRVRKSGLLPSLE